MQFAGCGNITLSYSPTNLGTFPPGSFPVGVTPVTVTATDKDGNKTNCTFTVTVTDTTPPVRSGGQPPGTLAAGTTTATLQVTTNEAATCKYATSPGVAYASMTGTFSTTTGLAHTAALTGLTNLLLRADGFRTGKLP